MPTLTQVYERYRHGVFFRTLSQWLEQVAYPWRLGEVRLYLEPNYFTFGTDICIRTDLLPDVPFRSFIDSWDLLNYDEFELMQHITNEFAKQLYEIHILPEDHIELGEN